MTLGLETIMTRIAASLTKFGRDQNNTVAVNGMVFHSEAYVAVDWRWISLPAILIAAAIIFLIAAIVINHSARFSVWKSSVLPLLYHGLEENMIPGPEQDTTRVSQMNHIAASTSVTMQLCDDKGRLVLKREPPSWQHPF